MSFLKKYWPLLLIVLLAAAVRFYQLSSVPPGLSWDEAAIGWNAKTIFHTRRDEYGTSLPLVFKSFGDYKAPLYIYLTAPIVGLFGLSPLTIRLLAVLSGIASVVFIYLITLQFFDSKRANLVGFLAAITPWGFLLSRGAFEASLALALILAGVYFWRRFPYLAILSLGASMYAYHSAKIFVPLLALGLWFWFRPKNWWRLVLFGALVLMPLIHSMLYSGAGNRFQSTSVFAVDGGIKLLPGNYLQHFSPLFLFSGVDDNFRQQLKDYGLLLVASAPLLVLGLAYLFHHRHEPKIKFLFWWLIVGPVAAAIGNEVPHSIRALNLLPAFLIVSSLWPWRRKTLVYGLLFLNFVLVYWHYLKVYPVYSAPDWQYGYQQVSEIARAREDEVDRIIITDNYGQPYIFTFIYQKREPMSVFWGAMSKYLYSAIDWGSMQHYSNQLIIASPDEVPADAPGLIETINFPDGSPAFRVVKTPNQS